MYNRLAGKAIQWRWAVLAFSVLFLVGGGVIATRLKSQFFPEDVQYWSYVDVWLPNDAPLSRANNTSQRVESIVRKVVKVSTSRVIHEKTSPALLDSVTTFVGGGGPRFWFSVSPEQQQQNYAQVLIQLSDKEATPGVIGQLQSALSKEIAGAYVTVHQLQTNPVEFPRRGADLGNAPMWIRIGSPPITRIYEGSRGGYRIFCGRSEAFRWYRTTGSRRAPK